MFLVNKISLICVTSISLYGRKRHRIYMNFEVCNVSCFDIADVRINDFVINLQHSEDADLTYLDRQLSHHSGH